MTGNGRCFVDPVAPVTSAKISTNRLKLKFSGPPTSIASPCKDGSTTARSMKRATSRADTKLIVRGAATADPELAVLRRELGSRRLSDMQTVAESLQQKGVLCPGMEMAEAMDLLWALGSAEMFRMLVVDRTWPPEWYERWPARLLQESLLCPPKDVE